MNDQQQIEGILSRLRGRIRRYVLVEGLAALIAVLCGLFWLTFAFDLIHFELRKLELPGWFRSICLLLMAGITVAALVAWVLLRTMRGFRSRALALVLERRFPELDDRFITAVELLDTPQEQNALQSAMRERTIHQAVDVARQLDLDTVFDSGPVRRKLLMASVLLATVLIFGVTNAQAMGRWFNAFILGRPDYWEPFRQSEMEIYVLAQPGDRRRDFDAAGVIKHPRGADLELMAVSREGKTPPSRVSLQFIAFGGSGTQRGRATMSSSGEREFHHTLSRVIDEHHVWVTGGDFVNRRPLKIQIVDPPRVDQIDLQCDYPSYTGRDSEEDHLVEVSGTQISLPMETAFELQARFNKAVREVHIRSRRFELTAVAGESTARLVVINPETEEKRIVTLSGVANLIDTNTQLLQLPLRVSAKGEESFDSLGSTAEFPLLIPSDTQLQISLLDQDDIDSPDPAILLVNGIVDLEPVVDSRLTGISSVITRGASIPVEGRILDDYGVVHAWFGYRVDANTSNSVRELATQPKGTREFSLKISDSEPVERFNVLPLELKEGQTLTLGVYAEDGDVFNGPHIGHGELFTFTIVTDDELLSRLNDRELNLRLRFEQIREEINDLRTSVSDHLTLDAERTQLRQSTDKAASVEPLRKLDVALGAFAERALHQLRKNHTESRSIEIGFRSLREELVNNHIDTKDTLQRIDEGVLTPLHALNEEDFGSADGRLGNFRLLNEQSGATGPALDESGIAIDAILVRMDQILAEMRDRGTLNEIRQRLEQLIEEELKLQSDTEKKRNESFFNNLGN